MENKKFFLDLRWSVITWCLNQGGPVVRDEKRVDGRNHTSVHRFFINIIIMFLFGSDTVKNRKFLC